MLKQFSLKSFPCDLTCMKRVQQKSFEDAHRWRYCNIYRNQCGHL